MTYAYLAILMWFAAGLVIGDADTSTRDPSDRGFEPPIRLAIVAIVCVGLCVSMALGLVVQMHAARLDPFGPHLPHVPIRMLDDVGRGDAATSDAELRLSLAQSALLFALFRFLRGRTRTRALSLILGATFVVLAGLAVTSSIANSSDLYGYVGFAQQPETAYATKTVPFIGDDAAIDAIFGNPRPAAWYGPLWIGVTHVLLLPFASLAAQLTVLRILEVAALVACVVVLARMGTSVGVLALLAVNPAIFSVWIVDGHNDLFGIAFVVAALAAKRYPALRIALVAAAGLVKLPLVVIGTIVFADETAVRRRIAYAATAIAATLVLSFVFGGERYLAHLLGLVGKRHGQPEATLHLICATAAVSALGAALFARRFALGGAWIWRSVAAFPAPWYAVWGLPYALASGSAAALLIVEPLDAYFFSWNYAATAPEAVAKFIALVGPASYALAVHLRRTRAVDVVPHESSLGKAAR